MTSPEGGHSPLQTIRVAVEVILVSGESSRIGILPESVGVPSSRQSADAGIKVNDPQRVGRAELGIVVSAILPLVSGGVDDRIAANAGMVGVGEIVYPADHRSGTQPIASIIPIRVVCPIKHECPLGRSRRSSMDNAYIQFRGHLGG